jgi:putative redox protein
MSRVTTTYKGDMLFEAQLGNHRLTIDSPEMWGGKDRGPLPPQLLMASIGSCVGVLVRQFCKENQLDASDLQVHVDYDVVDSPTHFRNIHVKINLPNAICDDARVLEALEHVAKHCPVHETIVTLERVNFEMAVA